MVVERLETCVGNGLFREISALEAEKRGMKLLGDKFVGEFGEYLLVQKHEKDHEFGSGGYSKFFSEIYRNGKRILETLDYSSWITTSDDSMDYSGKASKFTILHEEEEFGRAIINAIKKLNPIKLSPTVA